MAKMLRVGFVGVGDMGGPMARHIIQSGFPTTLWARRPEALGQFADLSFETARDLPDLGRKSDICGVCVFSDEDTLEVCLGEAGLMSAMAPGAIVLLHPTIAPQTAVRIAEAGERGGVKVLDAPVAGARVRAEEGALSVVVGGDAGAFQRAMPVMQAYGRSIRRMGPVGSGLQMKMLNNLLSRVNLAMAHEAVQLGANLGMDGNVVLDVLRSASADSFMLNFLADRILPHPEYARHVAAMAEKDMDLFERMRTEAGLAPSALERAAREGVRAFQKLGRNSLADQN